VAALPLVGVAAQAVLGGITVLTHLDPVTVAAHFLLSMVLVAVSTYLVLRVDEPDAAPAAVVRRELVAVGWALGAVTAVVLLLGTVVTGAGPHSGDATAPARLALDPRAMSWLHSDAVLVWFGLLGMLLLALHLTSAPERALRAGWVVVAVGAVQGVIGYVQYLTGLPVVAVAGHMLGACLLVVSMTWLLMTLRERRPA